MAILTESQPSNPNFLSPINFRFVMKRSPNLNFFATEANIPGISINAVQQNTPFVNIPRPGTRLMHEYFKMKFKVDENFQNYLEIFHWVHALGMVNGTFDYAELAKKGTTTGLGVYSDGTLSILDSAKNANMNVHYFDMFPISLSDINFNTEREDVQYAECGVTFAYRKFELEKL